MAGNPLALGWFGTLECALLQGFKFDSHRRNVALLMLCCNIWPDVLLISCSGGENTIRRTFNKKCALFLHTYLMSFMNI